ncbi:hypothetical protein NDU88_001734 [Pleurodeles waltl]|uniref:Uncharacterized protein n=1 Tax=Pleurodeles waltl TaxID=8319 RepID=A0AAV7WMN8_PLEWA|nr:hypothetical protein NDU88_001734 [Pleurodeles waltl]
MNPSVVNKELTIIDSTSISVTDDNNLISHYISENDLGHSFICNATYNRHANEQKDLIIDGFNTQDLNYYGPVDDKLVKDFIDDHLDDDHVDDDHISAYQQLLCGSPC